MGPGRGGGTDARGRATRPAGQGPGERGAGGGSGGSPRATRSAGPAPGEPGRGRRCRGRGQVAAGSEVRGVARPLGGEGEAAGQRKPLWGPGATCPSSQEACGATAVCLRRPPGAPASAPPRPAAGLGRNSALRRDHPQLRAEGPGRARPPADLGQTCSAAALECANQTGHASPGSRHPLPPSSAPPTPPGEGTRSTGL